MWSGSDGKGIIPLKAEVRIAARARQLRADGLTLRAVSRQLAAERLVGRRGKPFGPQSVANMLRAA
jgi:hypothetical protein